MDFIESSLCRLQSSIDRFVVPSAVSCDIGVLKAQIEFRRRALREIEVIRARLRPFMRCENKRFHRRHRNRHGNRLRIAGSLRARRGVGSRGSSEISCW